MDTNDGCSAAVKLGRGAARASEEEEEEDEEEEEEEEDEDEEEEEPFLSLSASLFWLVIATVVLAYLSEDRRSSFVDMVRSLDGITWVSNEGAQVLPFITEQVDEEIRGRTILAVDGKPVALAGPHGQSFAALGAGPR